MSIDRGRLGEHVDARALRERLEDLYARAFLPPTVTDEEEEEATLEAGRPTADDYDEFDFVGWLEDGRETGPTKAPAEARVVTDVAVQTTDPADPADGDYGEFAFADWLVAGESFDPADGFGVGVADTPAVEADDTTSDAPLVPRPSLAIHPAKAATYALFLAVAALAALSAVGYLPALGPAEGLAF